MTNRLRSPIKWLGGKGNMVAKLLPFIPDGHTYVEVFGGGASLLFAKVPHPVEVYNDLDGDLVHTFRVLRDPALFPELYRRCLHTPYSREEFLEGRDGRQDADDPLLRAWRFIVKARFSFGGMHTSWGRATTASTGGMAQTCASWLSNLAMLPAVHERLLHVQIEHRDWRKILDGYDSPETVFYCDPPYPMATRKSGGYQHELTDLDHHELTERLCLVKGKVLLSTYPSPIHAPLRRAGWRCNQWATVCHAVGRTRSNGLRGAGAALRAQKRTECLWRNRKALAGR